MDWSWLERLAPELVIVLAVGAIAYAIIQRAGPLITAAVDGINATVKSYESVSKQQADLFDRLDRLNQREITNLQKELDEEKEARTALADKLFSAQQELITLRVELDAAKRELTEEKRVRETVSAERDILAERVKSLESQVHDLEGRLDQVNHVKERKAKTPKKVTVES